MRACMCHRIVLLIRYYDYVHNLLIGFLTKYYWFAMTCPQNLRNAQNKTERKNLNSLETLNTVSTAVKANINNIRDTQNDRRKDDFNCTHKKCNFYWKVFSFPAFWFCFMLLTLCKMHSEIVLLHFFEWSGLVLIFAADSRRPKWTRNLSTIKIVLERLVPAKCEHGLIQQKFRYNKNMMVI